MTIHIVHTKYFLQTISVTRLESDHFDADISIGVKDLVAVENFTGRPFVIQFGCRFKGEPPYGNFGNVFVEELSKIGENKPVFSFLLNRVSSYVMLNFTEQLQLRFTFKGEEQTSYEIFGSLTCETLTSVSRLSILFSYQFLWYRQGEFV